MSILYFFCFKQKTAYEMRISDWSSDVCSSDLSVSQLEKNFNKKIGVSPKTYASMHRLFGLLRDKTENREDKWSALAYKHNYYDPIHFTREFNNYFNLNPSSFDFSRHLLL